MMMMKSVALSSIVVPFGKVSVFKCCLCVQIPNSEIFIDSSPQIYSNPEMEQIVVLAVCGRRSKWESGLILGNVHASFVWQVELTFNPLSLIHI